MCCNGRTGPGNRPFNVMFSRAWTPPANNNRQFDNNIAINLRCGDGDLRPVSVVSCTKVANYSGVNPASYSMSTGRLSSRIKLPGREVDHSPQPVPKFPLLLYAFLAYTRKILPLSRTWHVVTSLFMRKCKKRNLHNILVLRYAFSLDKIFIYLLFYWRTPILPQVS